MCNVPICIFVTISIHAPREGGDVIQAASAVRLPNFNPRPPRGGRLGLKTVVAGSIGISIHAPREGGDFVTLITKCRHYVISIHAPREGGDY